MIGSLFESLSEIILFMCIFIKVCICFIEGHVVE